MTLSKNYVNVVLPTDNLVTLVLANFSLESCGNCQFHRTYPKFSRWVYLFLDSKEETRPVDRRVSFEAILTKIVTIDDRDLFRSVTFFSKWQIFNFYQGNLQRIMLLLTDSPLLLNVNGRPGAMWIPLTRKNTVTTVCQIDRAREVSNDQILVKNSWVYLFLFFYKQCKQKVWSMKYFFSSNQAWFGPNKTFDFSK